MRNHTAKYSSTVPHFERLIYTGSNDSFLFDCNTGDEMCMDAQKLLRAPTTAQVPHSKALVIAY